jgi:capsular polysaccharide biosynthesis protein
MSAHTYAAPKIGRSVLRHPVIVILVTAAFAAAGYYWSSQQSEQYTATTRMFLSSSSPFDGFGSRDFVNNPDRYAVNQAAIALSRPVLNRAVENGELDVEVDRLRRALTISAGQGTDVIVIDATAPSPRQAADWANSVAEAFRAFKADGVEDQTQELLALSTNEADSAAILKRAAVYGDGIALVEQATAPNDPSSPQPVRDGLLAAVVGLVLGVAAAVLVDVVQGVRRSSRSREDPTRADAPSVRGDDIESMPRGDAEDATPEADRPRQPIG